ncbi:HIG1 domain family member 1C-like [Nomia melanderi]|uniref:HIG1 domain family member 1C-like n=1 Tax=Nomia melanderi TaxID=2448451 RepID=UPI00130476F5|nr:HIG1 domain family member 1A, mitochondrial-like [Nomia melanderi]XP_031844076.1 HIG1 domain family member 1A, mitochondrial-like [Nomia melanderi]
MDNTSQWLTAKSMEIPEEALRQTLENNPETTIQEKIYSTAVNKPFLVAGLVGFVVVGGIGAYKWKTRTIPPSLFLIQLRVAAQGTVLACLALGMLGQMYTGYKTYMENKNKK